MLFPIIDSLTTDYYQKHKYVIVYHHVILYVLNQIYLRFLAD